MDNLFAGYTFSLPRHDDGKSPPADLENRRFFLHLRQPPIIPADTTPVSGAKAEAIDLAAVPRRRHWLPFMQREAKHAHLTVQEIFFSKNSAMSAAHVTIMLKGS